MILIYQEYWFNDINFLRISFSAFYITFKEFLEMKITKIIISLSISIDLSPSVSLFLFLSSDRSLSLPWLLSLFCDFFLPAPLPLSSAYLHLFLTLFAFSPLIRVTEQIGAFIEFTPIHVKIKIKLTNFMK